jgi:hypothetical protein
MLPLGRNRSWGFAIKGKVYPKDGLNGDIALVRIVTPGYLRAMGMHLREGRDFSWGDGAHSPQVMIINKLRHTSFGPREKIRSDILFTGPARLVSSGSCPTFVSTVWKWRLTRRCICRRRRPIPKEPSW